MVLQRARRCRRIRRQDRAPNVLRTPRADDDRLLIGVRGDTSLTYVDVESRDADDAADSDVRRQRRRTRAPGRTSRRAMTPTRHHRRSRRSAAPPTTRHNRPTSALPDEPYALALDDHERHLLFIGHLTGNTAHAYTGGFSLFDVARAREVSSSTRPRLIAPFPSPFSPNSVGSVGVTALKAHTRRAAPNSTRSSRYDAPASRRLGA